jgi:hypothetical protein
MYEFIYFLQCKINKFIYFFTIKKKWKELGNSDLEIAKLILQCVGDGGGQGEQTSIRNYFGGKKSLSMGVGAIELLIVT